MSIVSIKPMTHAVHDRVRLPGSKSISNRALIMAALCQKPATLSNVLRSDDTVTCIEALDEIISARKGGLFKKKFTGPVQVYCQDSGIVTRFLMPVCAALGGAYHFDGSARMRERPIGALIEILQQQGVVFEFLDVPGKMPFILKAEGLPGGDVSVDIQDSSQFLSGLLIAAPLSQKGMVLRSNQMIAKKPYVLMTLELMAKFGVQHEVLDDFSIQALPQKYQPTKLVIEPDASTASYFFAAAALTKSSVVVEGLGMDSLQGDMRFLEVLERMGCKVTRARTSSELSGPQMFNALNEVDVTGFSDTFMTLAIMAPFLPTPTKIIGLRHTRLQESDRVAAMVDGLNRVGIRTEDTEDSLTIFPGTPVGAEIDSHRDHRIAMSFGVMGLVVPGISIAGAECVSKTCPEFFELLVGFSGT